MSTQPNDYSISSVYSLVSEELRREVAAFWLGNGAIPNPDEARRRADELVCMARNGAGEIVGVNTAYVASLRTAADRYYFYRMFIRPQDRHLHLVKALMRAAVEVLRARCHAEPGIRGVALVAENPKLRRAGVRRLLTHDGWRREGTDPRGLDIWMVEFD